MTVKEIVPNILCLEYRQDREDKDYGTCLWARFMFNLDRYEMTITSDCGNYGYKWCETPDSESSWNLWQGAIKNTYSIKYMEVLIYLIMTQPRSTYMNVAAMTKRIKQNLIAFSRI